MLVLIVIILSEFTTMAGRRLRDAVKTVLSNSDEFGSDIHVVIAGLTNTYSQYVTTFEEFEVQRYEVSCHSSMMSNLFRVCHFCLSFLLCMHSHMHRFAEVSGNRYVAFKL